MPTYRKYGLIAWILSLFITFILICSFFLPLIQVRVKEESRYLKDPLEYSFSASVADFLFGGLDKEPKFETDDEQEFWGAFAGEQNIIDYLYPEKGGDETSRGFWDAVKETGFEFFATFAAGWSLSIVVSLIIIVAIQSLKQKNNPNAAKAEKALRDAAIGVDKKILAYQPKCSDYLACARVDVIVLLLIAPINIAIPAVLRSSMYPEDGVRVSFTAFWVSLILVIALLLLKSRFINLSQTEIYKLPINEPLISIITGKQCCAQAEKPEPKNQTKKEIKMPASNTSDEMHHLELLEKYKSLLDSGIITEEEYKQQKERLLDLE